MTNTKPAEKPPFLSPDHLREWKRKADRLFRFLFNLPENWHRERDVLKNNYRLGVHHFRRGGAFDAVMRFRLVTWLDSKHTDAWYGLARAYLMQGKRGLAEKALKKVIDLNSAHTGARALQAALPRVYDVAKPELTLTLADDGMIPTLAVLHQDCFARGWDEKSLRELMAISGTQAWITGVSGLPMGMMIGRALGEQYEIITVCVSPEWRGRGLARQLMGALTARAKETGAKKLFLEVAVDNKIARTFYEHAGFAVINTRKDYYHNADGTTTDALVMSRELA